MQQKQTNNNKRTDTTMGCASITTKMMLNMNTTRLRMGFKNLKLVSASVPPYILFIVKEVQRTSQKLFSQDTDFPKYHKECFAQFPNSSEINRMRANADKVQGLV